MDKIQTDHITTNIFRLVKCTKNESDWYSHLLHYGFFTQDTWEIINKTESKTESIIREMYLHCLKTQNYNLLIQSLKDCENNIAATILEELDPTTSSTTTTPSKNLIRFEILPATKYYRGRDDDLETLHKYLEESINEKSLSFVQITGIGGVGKTELAKNFVKSAHFSLAMKCHCIWITSESNQTIFHSFQRLAKKIGVSWLDQKGKDKNLQLLASDVFKVVCEEHCILVFDDLESDNDMVVFKSLQEYTNMLSPSKIKPFCLLTSRFRHKLADEEFGHHFSKQIHLNVLSEEAAVSFFMLALEIDETSEIVSSVNSLCKKLEFFPLAMQQAVAFIKNALKRNDDLTAAVKMYLDAIDKQNQKLLDFPLSQLESLDEISRMTFPLWQITLSQIQKIPEIASNAKNVLNVISFFHSDKIEVELVSKMVERVWQQSHGTTLKTIQALDDYSMCHFHKIEDNKPVVSVHLLVQEITRINLDGNNLLLEFMDNFLTSVKQMLKDEIILSTQMIHIQSLWKHATKRKELVEKHTDFCDWISLKYFKSGKYTEGLEFTNGAMENLESVLGKDDKWTLRMVYWKGVFNSSLEEYQTALPILETVYEKQNGVFDDHALQTAREIGSVHWKLNFLEEAVKWMSETLLKTESKYGEEHNETLILKNLIALVMEDQGKCEDALKIHQEVLEIRERVLGSDHQDTLMTKNNIGGIKYSQKKYEGALKIHEEVLKARERVLGNNHPQTLNTKNWIGAIVWAQGKHKEALKILKQVLAAQEKVLGNNHPQTLHTKAIINDIKQENENKGCIIQ